MVKLYVIPYDIFGIKMYAVESEGGYIHRYCDTKERAEEVKAEIEEVLG